jgi:hypothetical protein
MTTTSSFLSRSLSRAFSLSPFPCRKNGQKKEEKKRREICQKTTKKMYRTFLIPFQIYTYDDKRQTHQNKIPRALVLDDFRKKK